MFINIFIFFVRSLCLRNHIFLSSSLISLVLLLGNSANAMDEEEKKHFAPRKDDKAKYPLSNPSPQNNREYYGGSYAEYENPYNPYAFYEYYPQDMNSGYHGYEYGYGGYGYGDENRNALSICSK
ncbi:hypothetical protein Bealeia1_01215 [Candidatus Bealeia paramacronuclearis]|uniref:Secreted protein n=1 Tax=Candidatus Bealeia paramacronuclearis TaxID=1921001 RepID=A0ABZ2C8H9_9PROT